MRFSADRTYTQSLIERSKEAIGRSWENPAGERRQWICPHSTHGALVPATRPLNSGSSAGAGPSALLAELGGDVFRKPPHLTVGRRELLTRNAPALHPVFDRLAFR